METRTLLTRSILPIIVCSATVFAYQKTITAEPGQVVTLACRAPEDKPVLVGEWSRTDLESEHVLLYRDDQMDPELQHPFFKDRVDLQDRDMKDGDVSLLLQNVTTEDSGTYECRVAHRGTNRRRRAVLETEPICTITLDVVYPPGDQDPKDTDEDGGPRDHSDQSSDQWLTIGLPVSVFLVAAGGGLLYWKLKVNSKQLPPGEEL